MSQSGAYLIEEDRIMNAETEKEEHVIEHAELRIKLQQAMTAYRQERELHDQMMEQEEKNKIRMNEESSIKKALVNSVKQLEQEVARLKTTRLLKEEEKPDVMSTQLQQTLREQAQHLKQVKADFKELQKQRRRLTIQRDRLVSERKKTLDSLSMCIAAEVTLKVKLEEMRKAIGDKDKDIHQTCIDMRVAMQKISNCDIRELTRDVKDNFEEMKKGQSRVMSIMNSCNERKKAILQSLQSATGPVIEQFQEREISKTRRCVNYILEVTGTITLSSLCMLMLKSALTSLFVPDCDLWTILYDVVKSYDE